MDEPVQVAWHLDGERRSRACEQFRKHRGVSRDPVHGGVGKHKIECFADLVSPLPNVTVDPAALWLRLTGGGKHFVRIIQPRDISVRPSIAEDLRAVSRTTPQVDGSPYVPQHDPRDEVTARLSALRIEFEVLAWVPHGT